MSKGEKMLLKFVGSMVMLGLAFDAIASGGFLFAFLFVCFIPLIIIYG